MTYNAWDIVAVPFPFTDRSIQKKRPALVLSQEEFNQQGHTLLAMITSTTLRWESDSPISEPASAGLSTPCVVRLKLFTLDNRLILRRLGALSRADQEHVAAALRRLFPPSIV